ARTATARRHSDNHERLHAGAAFGAARSQQQSCELGAAMTTGLRRDCTLTCPRVEAIFVKMLRMHGVGDGNRTHSETETKALTGCGWHILERIGVHRNNYWT